uniref:procollagen-proline 4-dioxygenase n=1 Tax=Ananas comosus var. bracteatus TaxID=296719 RepID=A0A6V7PWS8_ANACO|nr:unnamed protein product [Ananas comosus var. bracteatus]
MARSIRYPRLLPSKRLLRSIARRVRQSRPLPLGTILRYAIVSTTILIVAVVLWMIISVVLFLFRDHRLDPYEESLLTYQNEVKDEVLGERGEPWSEVLSWKPRVFMYHNFLSKEECEYLTNLAEPHLVRSAVINRSNGKPRNTSFRTSSSMFFKRGQYKTIRAIEKRIADFAFIPTEHGEGLQVAHYKAGERYAAHHDYFSDKFSIRKGGQRIATFLMYLSDVEKGGETVFPYAKVNTSSLPWYNELSACGKRGLAIKPKMGDAILFWSLRPDGAPDPLSMHEGCPVIEGNKWACTKWMHVEFFRSRQ